MYKRLETVWLLLVGQSLTMRAGAIGRRLASTWPAVAAWCLATAVVAGVAHAEGYGPLRPITWARSDSFLYLGIMRHGYTLMHCNPPDRQLWCGNAGWFPGYPWLVDALRPLGFPLERTAVAVSWAFSLATLVLIWKTFLGGRASFAALSALLYAAFAPGRIYDYALFPLSMLGFFTVAHLWLLYRRRFVWAGLAGAAAALTYPTGVVLAVTSSLWLLIAHDGIPLGTRFRRAALVGGLTAAGTALVPIVQRVEVGRWNAYLLVQDKYGHALQEPFAPAAHAVRVLSHSSPFRLGNAPQVQTVLVAFALACVMGELVIRSRRLSRLDLLLALWALGTWLLIESQANLSVYRSEASLLPLAVLVRRLPPVVLAALVAAVIWLTVPMTRLFVRALLE